MSHTPGPWKWRRPFEGDPEIWVEGKRNGDKVLIAILDGNETDAKMICASTKMYQIIWDVMDYVDHAWVCGDKRAEKLATDIRKIIAEVNFEEANF